MCKKISLLILLVITLTTVRSQKIQRQEFGINGAGLIVKNQATVAPSFFYRYKINDFQLRVQFAFDCKLTNENRDGFFKSEQSTFVQERDTAFDYQPAKNNTIGLILGFQKNNNFKNSAFKYFYGIDLIYMYKEYERTGTGKSVLVTSSSSQTTQNTDLKTTSLSKLSTMGVGVPLGITYYWDSKFFASIEAKFLMAYQETTLTNSTFSDQQNPNSQNQSVLNSSGGTTNTYGFDVGIKPLTGLCIGILF